MTRLALPDSSETTKEPFDLDEVFRRLRVATEPFAKAALFELRDDGYTSAFEQLVACIISIRTYDETMLPAARKLFGLARTPAQMMQLSVEEIDKCISTSTFHEAKARQIQEIAQIVTEQYNGELPCDFDILTSFRGVGPKCAGLVLGIACGEPRIGVDIHVHRVTNRWGYVSATTPEKTLAQLQQKLPPQYAVEINERLVPFGKHICTGNLPRCSTCPLLSMCRQIGVTKHR
ncbi:MAG TPA: endonuclease III [Abditibacteriaceae bacterium]